MLAYELIEYYSFVSTKAKEFMETMKDPINFIKDYSDLSELIVKAIAESTPSPAGNTIHYVSSNTTNLRSTFEGKLTSLRSRFAFLEPAIKLTQIKSEIEQYENETGITQNSIISKFLSAGDSFLKLYQTYMQNNAAQNALEFIKKLTELNYSYDYIQEIYSNTISILGDKEIPTYDPKNAMNLQFLDVQFSFNEFTDKLVTLNKVYISLGHLLYPEVEFQKLEIIKIESGSLLSAILGDKNILSAIGLFLTKAIETGFNKFTRDGQLLRHSELVEAISTDTELCKKFEDMGCDMQEARNNLAEAFTQATTGILKLSQSSSRIKLNDREFSYKDISKQKYIEAVKNPILMSENSATQIEE